MVRGQDKSGSWPGSTVKSDIDARTSVAIKSSLSLHKVIRIHSPNSMPGMVETSVISVPGYCTPPVSQWSVEQELERAAGQVDKVSMVHMYAHQPVYDTEDSFTWDNFLQAGSNLAEDLAQLSTEFPNRPIIFIAHSLGGTLLKKALLLAHQNIQDPRFKLVMDCLSGILFLGTPHGGNTDQDTLIRHNQILHNCLKFAMQKRAPKLPTSGVFQLANLATTFEQIAHVPVLSVYERAPRGHKKWGATKKALVDEELATISTTAERLLGVQLSHRELCKLGMLSDDTYSASEFLHFLLLKIVANRQWGTMTDRPVTSTILDPNPLNPLNLTDAKIPGSHEQFTHASNRSFRTIPDRTRSAATLPNHLRLSSMNNERLLESRKCQLPCFWLAGHSPNPDFVGREDVLAAMDQCLLPREELDLRNSQGCRTYAICGMGGLGKTDLAIHYAFSRRKHFGVIFWVEAGSVSQLVSDFGRMSVELGLESRDEAQNLESSKEIAKAWLNRPTQRRSHLESEEENDAWLLIFDNADNLDIITDFIPHNGSGSILITSRDPFAKTRFFDDGFGIDLECLSSGEAAGLLRRLIRSRDSDLDDDEQDASVAVADRLDGLPLAMIQTAGFIRRRHLTIREFVDLYSTDARYADVRNVSTSMQEYRYGHTLASAFNFDGLEDQSLRLLETLAFLSADRVPEHIFTNKAQGLGVQQPQWTPGTYENARYELLTSSIIRRNLKKKELWIHRVIQTEVRTRMQADQSYDAFNQALALVAAAWPPGDLCSQASLRWALCEDLFPHLERFYHVWNEYAEAWKDFEINSVFPILLNEAAVYLHERGFSHEGKAYLKLALELCDRANIIQEPLISDMHLTMGALCNETNDAQSCLQHNVLCLALRKAEAAKHGKPDLRLAFAHSQIGIAYMMVGKLALATEYFKQCVEMIKGLDVDVDEFGFPVCNLGLAYWLQGELEAADQTLTDLLKQREERHGRLDRVSYKTGRVLQALGNVKASKAKRLEESRDEVAAKALWDEVFELHTQCLKQYESTLGGYNHRTADACHKLAEHHIRCREDDLAQDYLARALSIWGDRWWFRNESARSSFLRGIHLQSMEGDRNKQEGKEWVERAKVLRKQILPDEADDKELTPADFDDLVCFWSI